MRADPRTRARRWAAAAGVCLVVSLGGAAGAALDDPTPPPIADRLEREAEAMVDAGVPANDPKVEMLEAEAEAIADGAGATTPKEPGVDLAHTPEAKVATSGSPAAMDRVEAVESAEGKSPWDLGRVDCEPIPPTNLTAAEIAGATCLSLPQPDGTARYVAITPDGTVRVVRFAAGGAVDRLPDRRLPAPPARGTAFAGTTAGDLGVTLAGESITVDVG